jgi:hypothetical protein
MPINFDFNDRVNKRSAGSEVIHYNEPHTVITGTYGSFTTTYLPLNIASPDPRRITVRVSPADTGISLTETVVLTDVISGSLKFYCDFSTGTVSVDPDLIGLDVYATYNGPNSPIVGEEYVVPAADSDGLCRILLLEAPLSFTLLSTDSRKIYVTSTGHGDLTETQALSDVLSNTLKYYVEFDVGRITFNEAMINDHVFISYYGTGSVVWAEDIRECHAAFVLLDQSVLHTDGSNPMTGNLDMGGNSIINTGSGTIDSIQVSTHNHEGSTAEGVQLDGQHAILVNTIQSGNLQNKTISGSGAVAVGNIQNNSVTHIELLSDKASLSKVSGTVIQIGGAANETLGINALPGASSTAEVVFRSQTGTASDKLLFHESGGSDGTSGVNVDANSNLVIYSLKNKRTSFRSSSSTGTAHAYIDSSISYGNFVVQNNVNTIGGKLQEGGYDLLPAGTVTAFYQATAPLGWTQVTEVSPGVPINDYALRIRSGVGGAYSAIGTGWSVWLQGHIHDIPHSHAASGTTRYGSRTTFQGYDSGPNNDGVEKNHVHTFSGTAGVPSIGSSGVPRWRLTYGPIGYRVGCRYADVILASKD